MIYPFLPFSPETMNIKKVETFVANLHDKEEYIIHIKKFKTSIKLWISLEKSA